MRMAAHCLRRRGQQTAACVHNGQLDEHYAAVALLRNGLPENRHRDVVRPSTRAHRCMMSLPAHYLHHDLEGLRPESKSRGWQQFPRLWLGWSASGRLVYYFPRSGTNLLRTYSHICQWSVAHCHATVLAVCRFAFQGCYQPRNPLLSYLYMGE